MSVTNVILQNGQRKPSGRGRRDWHFHKYIRHTESVQQIIEISDKQGHSTTE